MSSSASTGKPDPIVLGRRGARGLPYSKYLMSQSLSASGVASVRAYELARTIERRLQQRGEAVIGVDALRRLAEDVLRDEEGEHAVERFRNWQLLDRLDRPLVVMLAGTTGVGKSTLATMLAHRLGITRVIATDVIRHVLRSFLSRDFMPAVHYSAFDAAAAVEHGEEGDPDLVGFELQAESIGVGVAAIVDRACTELTPMVVEGVHLLPGGLEDGLRRRCVAVEALLVVGDEELHRGHFALRGGAGRPAERYLARFEQIRKLQAHLAERARAGGVPVIDNVSIEGALGEAMELVLRTAGRLSSPAS